MPKLLILGWARHGKDTVAEFLEHRHGVTFRSSSYFLAQNCVRPFLEARGITYDSLADCYDDRGNHRDLWREAIVEYNADPTRLTREILAVADCYVGMRSAREFEATKHFYDKILWVDASGRGLPPEPKSSMDITYDPSCMTFVNNSGTLQNLIKEVDAIYWKVAA